MTSWRKGWAVAALAAAFSFACGSLLDSAAQDPVRTVGFDDPVTPSPAPVANTGQPAGDAFLVDFVRGYDERTHYLSDYEMNEEWIKIAYRPGNVRFSNDRMVLVLQRLQGKMPFAGAEFQRRGRYGYGRYEAVMTASGASGVVSSFFTHTNAFFDDPHDEIDFEFTGRDPRQVHLNYFHNGRPDPFSLPLWFDASQADHLYAFEWTPDSIRWFIDGVMVREVTAESAKAGIPTTSSRVMVNIWAGTGALADWTGEAQFTGATASYRCISHVPIGKTGRQCSDSFTPPPKP